ncbi:MAG: hypothetical protein NVS9B9_31100 [Ktedonobacteraceae bacterium]
MSTPIDKVVSWQEHSNGEDHRQQVISNMRDMLTFIESHPDVPLPYFGTFYINTYDLVPLDSDGEVVGDAQPDQILAKVTKAVMQHGKVEKIANSYSFGIQRKFDDGSEWDNAQVALQYSGAREEVCKKVPTGGKITKTISKLVSPAVYEDVEVEEDATEWECPPILSKLNRA